MKFKIENKIVRVPASLVKAHVAKIPAGKRFGLRISGDVYGSEIAYRDPSSIEAKICYEDGPYSDITTRDFKRGLTLVTIMRYN